ncbi:hypothetical protein SISSUDRAFT_1049464 [Sistotremastrum suecicum HHB10207 ss-3]|uniref:DUF7330 domain-containing protein n=1 Tax=Sistotremastrum suecicum HHB10207 ss-3 TaxID=1314776 RepID=A0A166BTH6_9AGAM|nr:hypothetical protein SISSUDRAFT_1049464 [Sistotremastrum suecicum HHB10207 ss-3]
MIILGEKSDSSGSIPSTSSSRPSRRPSARDLRHVPPPPTYASSSVSSKVSLVHPRAVAGSSTSTLSLPRHSAHNSQKTNHLYVLRPKGSIKGAWVIDVSVLVPPSILPKIRDGETRKNLKLHALAGKIAAGIELRRSGTTRVTHADIEAFADHGSVKLKIERSDTVRFRLLCRSNDGSSTIYIPRNFRGSISMHVVDGEGTFSSAVSDHLTFISRQPSRSVHFLGDFPGFNRPWDGDDVEVEVRNGNIKISYVDEFIEQPRLGAGLAEVAFHLKDSGFARYIGRFLRRGAEAAISSRRSTI